MDADGFHDLGKRAELFDFDNLEKVRSAHGEMRAEVVVEHTPRLLHLRVEDASHLRIERLNILCWCGVPKAKTLPVAYNRRTLFQL